MNNRVITGSIIDIISFILEVMIIRWFFRCLPERVDISERPARKTAGSLPLFALLLIYMTPLNAAVSVYSIQNLCIQLLRMILHLVPVMCWLIMNKECKWKEAAYLSGLFTAIYITAQNLRMVIMTYGIMTPPHQTLGAGYIAGVVFATLIEFVLAAITRRFLHPEEIDIIDKQRVIMMAVVLMIMVYFKWILTAVRELSIGGNRVMMVSFSLVTSLGLYLVLLLYDYSWYLMQEKQHAERESMVLQYEVSSAKREMQAAGDIRRLYHDVKNHLLAIKSMAANEGEVKKYLNELLPQFEGYETQVSTGNQTVDAILSEKIQLAYRDGIRFNVCLDLSSIGYVKTVDLVTIFGNAVDNAIEALRQLSDSERKEELFIYIKSSSFANNTVIRFQNKFAGVVEMQNGIPATRKKDSEMHGIGIGSIKNAVSRYGGTVTVKADNEEHQFTLVVMLPSE